MNRSAAAMLGLIMVLTTDRALAQQITPEPGALLGSQTRWAASDKCLKDSEISFPDPDLASLRQRDRYVDDCLKKHHLPPRAHLAPDTP
jgi:hypothetical protein